MPLISYKLYLEMAPRGRGIIQGHMSKFPLNYDDDDLKFLNQFDMKYYAQASEQRFDMLHDALKKLHDKRLDIIKNGDEKKGIPRNFVAEIKEFLLTNKSKKLSQEVQKKIRSYRNLPIIQATMRGGNDKFYDKVNEIAEEDAFEIVKQKTENLKVLELDPPDAKFMFNKGYGITATPYLNRLYHRLERTKDEAHIGEDDSEHPVGSVGKYGYDLSHPHTEHDPESGSKKHYTRGMSWVGSDVWERSIKEYIKHSSHGHFGDHPRVEEGIFNPKIEIKWLPMDGKDGRPKIEDPTYDWMLEDEIDRQTKKMKEDLHQGRQANAASNPKKVELKPEGKKPRRTFNRFDKALTDDQKKDVKKIATEIVNNKVRSGEVSAPSVPGVDPKERKFEIRSGKRDDKKPWPFGGLISPFVYLPHEYIDNKWMPLLNPSTYLKKVKDEEENTQYKLDDTDRPGAHFGDTTDSKNVGISPNKNVPSKNYLDPNDPANDTVVKEFEKGILMDGEIRTKFEQGVRNCLTGNCGGATSGVKEVILNNPSTFAGLVNDVIIAAYDQLGKHSKVWSDPTTFAIGVVTNYLQGAVHDMATRRLRRLHVHGLNDSDPSVSGIIAADKGKKEQGGRVFSKDHRAAMNKAQKEYDAALMSVARAGGTKGLIDIITAGEGSYADFFDAVKEELIGTRGISQTKAELLVRNWIKEETPLPKVADIVNGMKSVPGNPISGEGDESSSTILLPAPLPSSKPAATSVKSPLMKHVQKITGGSPAVDTPQIDWKILSGLTFFERVEILKRIRRS